MTATDDMSGLTSDLRSNTGSMSVGLWTVAGLFAFINPSIKDLNVIPASEARRESFRIRAHKYKKPRKIPDKAGMTALRIFHMCNCRSNKEEKN